MRKVFPAVLFLLLGACARQQAPLGPGEQIPQSAGQATQPAAAGVVAPPAVKGPFADLVAGQIAQAGKAEVAGDLRGALESWKVVAALRPEAAEPRERVAALTGQLNREAEHHFQRGLESFDAGAFEPARREFLLALRNNPEHAEALDYLKNRIDPLFISYRAAVGETFESIAKKVYSDSSKAIIIARLNDLDPKAPLVPGTTLLIPSSLLVEVKSGDADGAEPPEAGNEPESPVTPSGAVQAPPVASPEEKKKDAAKQSLLRAQELFLAHLYPECILVAENLVEHPSFGKKARDLINASWFERGNRYLKEDRFQEAIDSYKKVDPAARDLKRALSAVEVRRREKAEEYYNDGVKLFINQKLKQAITVWQKTLVLNPAHPKAPKDIEKARALLERLKALK